MKKLIFLVLCLLFTNDVYSAPTYKQLSDEEIQDFHDALNVINAANIYQSHDTKSYNKYKQMNEDVENLLKAKLVGSTKTRIEEWQLFTNKYIKLAKNHSHDEIEFYNKNKVQLFENGCYRYMSVLIGLEQIVPVEVRANFYAGGAYKYGFVDYCRVHAAGVVVSTVTDGDHEQVYNRKKSYLLGDKVFEPAEKQFIFIQNKYGKYKPKTL